MFRFRLEVFLMQIVFPFLLMAHHINQQSKESQQTKIMQGRLEQESVLETVAPGRPGEHRHRHGHGSPEPASPLEDIAQSQEESADEPAATGADLEWTTASPVLENKTLSLRETRLELIMRQILQKLRMTDRPNITSQEPTRLPQPLSLGALARDAPRHRRVQNDGVSADEMFYGTTKQVILVGQPTPIPPSQKPSACFTFTFSDQAKLENAKTAELWVYKRRDPLDGSKHNQTLTVSELEMGEDGQLVRSSKVLAMKKTFKVKSGWAKFDMSHTVRRWFHRRGEPLENETKLVITCKTCGMDSNQSPVETIGDLRPLLVIYTSKRKGRKTKRSASQCGAGSQNCCREHFMVSFAEIGWSDWILAPAGYVANYCRGSCSDPVVPLVVAGRTHHSNVMMTIGSRERHIERREDLKPCCTASKMSGLSLLYRDNEGTIVKADLPNMKVDACGCA